MFYDYRAFIAAGQRRSRPSVPVVPIERVRPFAKPATEKKAAPAKRGLHLAAVPLKRSDHKKVCHDDVYMPRLVPVPGTKVPLAPFGAKEPHQVIKAAVVASQIAEDILISERRIPEIFVWRAATYFALCDLFPKMTRSQARTIMRRDRSTLIHYERRRIADPEFLADKVKAIKEVLV